MMRRLWLGLGAACAVTSVGCSTDDAPDTSNAAGTSSAAGNSTTTGGNGSSGGASTQAGSSAQAGDTSANQGGSVANGGGNAGSAGSSSGGASSCAAGTSLVAPTVTECPAATPAGPPADALAIVNTLRAHMGLPCMTLVPEINTSAQKHCDYYQQNEADKACIANAHEEVETCPGFVAKSFSARMTAAGYAGQPRSEVMAFSGDPARAIAMWINSVYHRTPLLSPWLAEMGYGMTEDCDTIDLGLAKGAKPSDAMTAVYPYPGQVDVPVDFDGSHEGPTPPEPPTGWPSASPVHLYVKSYTVTSHEVFIKQTCEALPHQWLPDKEQYILYPDKPFAKNTEYRVVIKGTKGGAPLDFDWTFTTED
jgi:uncharacterized protein YkwD